MFALVSFLQNFCRSCWHSPSAIAVAGIARVAASEAARMVIAVFVIIPCFPHDSHYRRRA